MVTGLNADFTHIATFDKPPYLLQTFILRQATTRSHVICGIQLNRKAVWPWTQLANLSHQSLKQCKPFFRRSPIVIYSSIGVRTESIVTIRIHELRAIDSPQSLLLLLAMRHGPNLPPRRLCQRELLL